MRAGFSPMTTFDGREVKCTVKWYLKGKFNGRFDFSSHVAMVGYFKEQGYRVGKIELDTDVCDGSLLVTQQFTRNDNDWCLWEDSVG